MKTYDVVIAGGGPAGLEAALVLGRGRKQVLLCDAGPRRNAKAEGIHNFVTRDGVAPDEFRRLGREQLKPYPSVEVRDVVVAKVSGTKGAFQVELGGETVLARRLLLCTGLIDDVPAIEGLRDVWGDAVFQCPYCHGWEQREKRWGYWPKPTDLTHFVPFALQLRGWTKAVTVFTNGAIEVTAEQRAALAAADISLQTKRITRLVTGSTLEAIELEGGTRIACDVLFTHPPQSQCALVKSLGLTLDADGFVQIVPMKHETSVPGIYAAGDLTTRAQGALFAAAAGMQAAAMINVELTAELASSGRL